MKPVSLLVIFLTSAASYANPILLGNFGHQFAHKPTDTVWTIRNVSGSYELTVHGNHTKSTLQPMSQTSVRALWEKLMWPTETTASVSCIGNEEDIFCHVPADRRKNIKWLAKNRSDFFFYSDMGGVMEIQKVDP